MNGHDRLRPAAAKPFELPFRIRIVRNDEQLLQAVRIRSEAYARHVPTLKEILSVPEDVDRGSETIVLLAEAKSDGVPLGTVRIQTNFSAPLSIQESVDLPAEFRGRPLAGVSRLGVKAGPRGRLVKIALIKAMYRYCLAKQVEWALIGARPPLDGEYLELGFKDVFADQQLRPLHSALGLPHRILSSDIVSAERNASQTKHPLYEFMFRRFHPDIEIFSSVNSMWRHPRKDSNLERRFIESAPNNVSDPRTPIL
jgi:hypothetical protein